MVVGAWGVSMTRDLRQADAALLARRRGSSSDYAWLEEKLGPLVPMEVVIRIDKSKCKLDLLDQMVLVSQVQQCDEDACPTWAARWPPRPSPAICRGGRA